MAKKRYIVKNLPGWTDQDAESLGKKLAEAAETDSGTIEVTPSELSVVEGCGRNAGWNSGYNQGVFWSGAALLLGSALCKVIDFVRARRSKDD